MRSSEAAAKRAIARGQADVLASRVTPHRTVAGLAGVKPTERAELPAERAVVWSETARDTYLAAIEELTGRNPQTAQALADAIDRAVERLGRAPAGVESLAPHTWETAVPDVDYVLVFELVTWTKAGEVIAIDALLQQRGDPSLEAPLF